jgi:hypothetical protein
VLVTAGVAAADILVVRSVGPSAKSFPPGKRLPEAARISLKASDQLVVLDGRGTRTIRGPGTFTAGVAQGRIASAAPTVTANRARIGAVRSVGTDTLRPPSLWHIDVTKGGAFCGEPGKIGLWRSDSSKPVTLNITRTSDGASRQLAWQPGESSASWPTDLPITDGGSYRLSWSGATAPTALTLRVLPQRLGLEDMASWLIRNDCKAQLDLLIDTVRLPEASTPPG